MGFQTERDDSSLLKEMTLLEPRGECFTPLQPQGLTKDARMLGLDAA